jgi:putative flippase GtrA
VLNSQSTINSQLFKFLVVGIWNTIFGTTIFLLISYFLHFKNSNYVVVTIASMLGVFQSHLTQRVFVWKTKDPYFPELIRFTMGYLLIFTLNLLAVLIFVDLLGFNFNKTQMVFTIFSVFLSFGIGKLWTYRTKESNFN